MKKTLIIMFFALLATAMVYGLADAAVCSGCHTMHNSQNGDEVDTDGPNAQLLKTALCITCHTAPSSESVNSAYGDAPRVLAIGNPNSQGNGATNAGGDFYWLAANDEMGHNVGELKGQDGVISSYTPPGWDVEPTKLAGFAWGAVTGTGGTWGTQLTCAGTYGCHGDHDVSDPMASMSGSHHNDSEGQIAGSDTNLGANFRFLGGIVGYEDSNYQWTESSADHNEYVGIEDLSGRGYGTADPDYSAAEGAGSISFLCAECHGIFHGNISEDDTQTATYTDPWRRHPTDIELPNAGEYSDYNPDGANAYSNEAPVARTSAPASASGTVTPGTDIVMCLSCHRAHGSPEPDLLRFTYDMNAGDSSQADTGCFVCHTLKNGE